MRILNCLDILDSEFQLIKDCRKKWIQEELDYRKREEQEAAKLKEVENPPPELSDEEVTVEVISDEL